mmetsp:Transcript_772/g.1657  ORF Transcript_772/g.1657 Transcript_772/m.1657 type:complete len:226 (+) Transcript_772:587-1264(+)
MVIRPSFFNTGRSSGRSTTNARANALLMAPALPPYPPPRANAMMSYSLSRPVASRGDLTSCTHQTLFWRYDSPSRPLITKRPSPGLRMTLALADLRLPLPAGMTISSPASIVAVVLVVSRALCGSSTAIISTLDGSTPLDTTRHLPPSAWRGGDDLPRTPSGAKAAASLVCLLWRWVDDAGKSAVRDASRGRGVKERQGGRATRAIETRDGRDRSDKIIIAAQLR